MFDIHRSLTDRIDLDILRSAVNDFEQTARDFEKRATLIDSNE